MQLKSSNQDLPFPLSSEFTSLVTELLKERTDGVYIISLQDSSYSSENGGFRPVKIKINLTGDTISLHYLTEFSYVGFGDFAELAKSTCFDFLNGTFYNGVFTQGLYPDVSGFWELYTKNLKSYVDCGWLDRVSITDL